MGAATENAAPSKVWVAMVGAVEPPLVFTVTLYVFAVHCAVSVTLPYLPAATVPVRFAVPQPPALVLGFQPPKVYPVRLLLGSAMLLSTL